MENEIKDSRGDAERQRAQSETVVDIVAKMRESDNEATCPWWAGGGDCELCPMGGSGNNCPFDKFAYRFEAAHKREVEKLNSVIQATVSRSDAEIDRLRRQVAELRMQIGNAAKLREALEKAISFFDRGVICTSYANSASEMDELERWYDDIAADLAEPPRNCDVGTPEEQAKRLSEWCNGRHCVNCQFKGGWPDECNFQWAQMPYTESEVSHGNA